MLNDQHVHPGRQRGGIDRPQRHGRVRPVAEDLHAGQGQRIDRQQGQQQAGQDARRPQGVERPRPDAVQPAPTVQRVARDQETRHHEEHRHTIVAVARERVQERPAQQRGQPRVLQRIGNVEVMQQHQQDGHAAQHVDPRIARVSDHRGLSAVRPRPASPATRPATARARMPAFGLAAFSSWIRRAKTSSRPFLRAQPTYQP